MLPVVLVCVGTLGAVTSAAGVTHSWTRNFLKESVFDADQLVDALERVAGGGTAMDPAVIAKLLSSGPSNRRLEGLTEREHSVLGLMAEELSNQAIGRRLFLSSASSASPMATTATVASWWSSPT